MEIMMHDIEYYIQLCDNDIRFTLHNTPRPNIYHHGTLFASKLDVFYTECANKLIYRIPSWVPKDVPEFKSITFVKLLLAKNTPTDFFSKETINDYIDTLSEQLFVNKIKGQ